MRRHVDVLPAGQHRGRDLCRVGADELHRVIPNFIRALPPAPADADARLAALPREPFILYFGDVTVDKGAGLLVEAYRTLERAAAAGPDRPLLPARGERGARA